MQREQSRLILEPRAFRGHLYTNVFFNHEGFNMTNWKTIGGSAVFMTLMGSTASIADVTSQEVWNDWYNYMTSYGYEVTVSPEVTSDSVIVDGMKMSMPLPDNGGTINVNLGKISFKDNGDGTVSVMLSDISPLTISANNDFSVSLNYDISDMSMVVSGSAEDMTYTYSAPQMALSIADLVVDGEKLDDAKLDIVLTNLSGTSNSKMEGLRKLAQNFTAEKLTYDFALAEPNNGDFSMTIKGSMADLAGKFDSSIPAEMDFSKMADALDSGFASGGTLSWGAGGYDFASSERGNSVTGSSSSESGSLTFALSRDALNYAGTAKGTKASFTSSDLPFPVEITSAESVFNLLMPAGPSDEPKDYNFTLKMIDFNVNDMIWSMADPTGKLPHDPATVVLDLNGKGNWFIDIMNPEEAAANSEKFDVPGELHSLELKDLQLKVAGADLTGNGAFTFNNDDLETFDGIPAPSGELNLKLVGGNALMDNLVAMGLLPEDQAMGVRMMMGLFAVASGEDTLTSKIEVKEDGSVLANGQRLQ